MLNRPPGDQPATWLRVHEPRRARGVAPAAPAASVAEEVAAYRVRLEAGHRTLGSLWAVRHGSDRGRPPSVATRLLAATADRIAGSLERDRLAALATETEVARRSDALKSALLESVSHDLRTPLATIRAAAGTLASSDGSTDPPEVRALGATVDHEAQRLDRLVTNLLDLSRISAGTLAPTLEPHDLADVVGTTVARAGPLLDPRPIAVDVPADLPPAWLDEVLMDQVLTNLLDNIASHTPPTTMVRITGRAVGEQVAVIIEDDGPGVPTESLPLLFDRFYRVPSAPRPRLRGTGIGLSVARGLTEAMGGTISARRAEIGGLAVEVRVRAAAPPPEPSWQGAA